MTFLLRSSAAAAIFGLSITSAAFAQQASQQHQTPYSGTGAAPVCTQLERIHGIRGEDCGKLSLEELAKKKIDRDNT
ncbi:hypothetical protein HNP73_001091 [Amaricoccus macauensis]|uniref:YARHG domain-containing protein n=1 Tax=Amaricoccus macauensis TaxID=57001 RepID=A0A840SK81_9RHOB|nr:hypothetical protein [Amaricoccus macauensis]MBB5221170.1 hypothetical protein [Amaricoccus macauensis]